MKSLQHHTRTVKNKPVSSYRSKGVKNRTLAPRLKEAAPSIHRVIFGKDLWFPSQAALNRHNLRQRFLGEAVQQNQFEAILDANPANRFRNHSDPSFKTRRYATSPGVMISTREQSDSVLSAAAKSRLTEQGQLHPVGKLPHDVWTEDYPHSLANLGYAHVYELNKVKDSVAIPAGSTAEDKEQLRLDLISKVEQKLHTGSPITSTTINSLIDDYLKTWGVKGECIEIDAHQTNIVSPSYVASLIMYAASNEKIDAPTKNNWRKEYPESLGPDMKKMEKLLIQHGIDPDGKWTNRERCAYYALVAGEHMLIGTTPVNTARLVKY